MFNEGSPNATQQARIPLPLGLFGMLVIGLFGAYVMPVSPGITVLTLVGVAVLAVELLVSDKPSAQRYYTWDNPEGVFMHPPRGRDAMDALYTEIADRTRLGEQFAFGEWARQLRRNHAVNTAA